LPTRNLKVNNAESIIENLPCQYRWDPRRKENYMNSFQTDELVNLELKLADQINANNTTCSDVGEVFNDYINAAIKNIFKRKRSVKAKFPVNSWFNEECKNAKKLVVDYARRNDITEAEHAQEYRQLEKNYNRIKQREKRNYSEEIRCRLENFSAKDPSSYWKMWKSLKHNTVNNSTLTVSDFNTYFKAQIYPPEVESFDTDHMDEIKDFVMKYETHKLS
jgi:hypothetical protein